MASSAAVKGDVLRVLGGVAVLLHPSGGSSSSSARAASGAGAWHRAGAAPATGAHLGGCSAVCADPLRRRVFGGDGLVVTWMPTVLVDVRSGCGTEESSDGDGDGVEA